MNRFLTVVSLFAFMFSSFVVMGTPLPASAQTLASHAPTLSVVSLPSSLQVNTSLPQWVHQGEKFVHVSNYTATVDSSITKFLDSVTVSTIKSAVARYNSLSYDTRAHGITNTSVSTATRAVHPQASPWCPDVVRNNSVWWGWSYWLNSCSVTDLAYGGVAAALVVALFTGPGGFIVGIYVANLQWAAGQCRDGSAFFNDPYAGPKWFAPGC